MKQRIFFLMLAMVCCMQTFAAKANKAVNIQVNGETRSYWLYVPNKVNTSTATPLVVSLHGAGGNPIEKIGDRCPMGTDVADQEGFIVVYPQGKLIYFPVFGGSVNGWDASGEENDDVEFIKAVIEDVAKKYTVDRNRIYCCGFSNGGMMTYALTNTCSDTFAAFASISGFPLNEFHFRHTGARPVPFLHIHGKADDFVKYSCMPIIVDEMVARIGANPVPKKTTVSGQYDKSVYEAGEGSFPYVYYEMDGMGHSAGTGNTPEGNSAKTMWKHFKQYTLDTPCDRTLKWRPRLETEGYEPKKHGWFVNSSTYALLFGRDQHKADNSDNNVYRSFQLDKGIYKLCFHSEGEAGKKVTAKIKKLTSPKNTVLDATAKVGEDACLYFKVEDGWGEYTFSIVRESSSDAITITDLALYSTTEKEMVSKTGVSFSEGTFTYTGVAPEIKWTDNAKEEGYTTTLTQPELHAEAGTYKETIPVTFTKGEESFSADFSYEYTIEPVTLKAKMNNASRVYGEENPTFEIVYTGFVNDETESALTTQPVAETTATTKSNAGTYPITLQGGEAKNYIFEYEDGELTVTPKPLTISVGTYERSYNQENPEFTLTYEGWAADDTEESLQTKPTITTAATTESDTGTYPVEAAGAESPNYTITYEQGTLTIVPAEQTLSWEQELPELTVGDEIELLATASSELPVTYTMDEVDGAELYESAGSTFLKCTAACEFVLKAVQEGNTNYLAAEPITKEVKIVAKEEEDTGVDEVASEGIQILPTANGISVSGAATGELVQVYTTGGTLQATAIMNGDKTNILIAQKGTYLVKVGKTVKKVHVE